MTTPSEPTQLVRHVLDAKRLFSASPRLVAARPRDALRNVLHLLQVYNISQIPVIEDDEALGAIHEKNLLPLVLGSRSVLSRPVADFMSAPLGTIDDGERFPRLHERLSGNEDAVLVTRSRKPVGLLTRADLLSSWVNNRSWDYEI